MSAYELYLLLHIGAAMVWVGAAFTMVLTATRATLAHDRDRMRGLVKDGEWLGLRLFLPANLIVLVSAVLLVHEGQWGYGPLWIRLGVLGFAASFLAGALFFGPGWGRIERHAAREGGDARGVESALRRLLFGSWLDVGWLLAVVFVMTVKPGGDEWVALGVAAAIPIAFGVVAALLLLHAPTPRGAMEGSSS